jgi:hypothetical protein
MVLLYLFSSQKRAAFVAHDKYAFDDIYHGYILEAIYIL